MNAESGKLRIYGCGGAGVNLVEQFEEAQKEPNCAEILPCYVDTSRSNLTGRIKENRVFILDNVDGSGKVRKENHQEISNVIKKVLLQFEPGDLNVVVFSASGGSGSVIGPLIMSELLSRGESAIAIVIGSDESVITANNTLNTIKSLESISKMTDAPLVMYYEHNDRKRSEVDKDVKLAISVLSVLASKENRELDTKDISNWLHFNRTTSVGPQLANLEIFTDSNGAGEVLDPISVVSIYESEDMDPLKTIPEYHAAGYMTTKNEHYDEFHFVVNIDGTPAIVREITETLGRYETQRNSRVARASIVSDSDNTTETGLVL